MHTHFCVVLTRGCFFMVWSLYASNKLSCIAYSGTEQEVNGHIGRRDEKCRSLLLPAFHCLSDLGPRTFACLWLFQSDRSGCVTHQKRVLEREVQTPHTFTPPHT